MCLGAGKFTRDCAKKVEVFNDLCKTLYVCARIAYLRGRKSYSYLFPKAYIWDRKIAYLKFCGHFGGISAHRHKCELPRAFILNPSSAQFPPQFTCMRSWSQVGQASRLRDIHNDYIIQMPCLNPGRGPRVHQLAVVSLNSCITITITITVLIISFR